MGVMKTPQDRDAERPGGHLRSVTSTRPDRNARSGAPVAYVPAAEPRRGKGSIDPVPGPVSPAAARARRYRARKRGQDVPLRKPGPKPKSLTALHSQVSLLTQENRNLRAQLGDAQALPMMMTRQRQGNAAQLARQLTAALGAMNPAKDGPQLREMLRDVAAAIDMRHDQWPE
jgi:hypothetical protein